MTVNNDATVTDATTEPTEPVEGETTEPLEPAEPGETAPVVDPDAGAKKALVAERAARKAAEKELAAFRAEAALKDKPVEEQAIEKARAEGRTEQAAKSNERYIRAELKAAATGKVKNPALALKLIDMSGIDVDDDGEVDSDAIQAAVTDLLTEYPELAVDAARFGGGADQGAKGKAAKATQLSAQEVKNLSPAEVLKADREGRLDALKGITK